MISQNLTAVNTTKEIELSFSCQEFEPYNLRSRGLCLVPVSCTLGVARSNGADIWAPIKTTSPKFEKSSISQFH
ncbi:hypothetical protein TorRG33x02_118780 [Trema orientale]|uniref:Uncharacterized protein n=1 Tax=Trema orientale TaxID=63057 RepID=A0A2P5F3J6_TREOI|nr:hypothetical protein TorRG33x02_118780 [Trema orientale]